MLYGKDELLPRVIATEPLPEYRLLLTFNNGEKRLFDASELLEVKMFVKLRDVFDEVRVEYGTAVWPGDIDISPDTLYLRSNKVNV